MKSVHSLATINRYKDILNRPDSIANILRDTVDGLSNEFSRSDKTPEELIFELFRISNKDEAAVGKLIAVLKSYGIHDNDPRLRKMMELIWDIERRSEERTAEAKDPKHWRLNKKDFCRCVSESLGLISATLRNQLVIPSWTQFCSVIQEIFNNCKQINSGNVASYIPQLARVDPNDFAVAICTVDGQRVAFGDSRRRFCFQSVSKAFNYAIAASDLGADVVHKYVGQEPSGRLYNEICLDAKNIPHNPLIATGAITIASLLKPSLNSADRFDSVLNIYKRIAGNENIGFNNAVFLSERQHSNRAFALVHYLNEYHCLPPSSKNLGELMDFYFQLMALETTSESAAVMASTLANGGVCPITDERVIESRPCRDLLSLMYSCGLYDYSGQFAFHCGLPAKSSTSGVLIVAVPNLMGICLYSPPLDELGNSVRGVEFCKQLISRFALHNYDNLAHTEQNKIDPRKRIGEMEKDEIVSMLFAARSGRIYIRGVNLEQPDYDKRTALHVASSEGQIEIVKFLLGIARVKADPVDRWGRTPMDDATHFKHTQIVALLERAIQVDSATSTSHPEAQTQETPTQTAGKSTVDNGYVDFYVSSTDSETNINEDELEGKRSKKPPSTSRSKFSIGDDDDEQK
ncbi:No extended memory [Aphelenchoides bicaudatus]|nr:No extended memory [Aphelenchoides bicaudatus]